MQLDSLVTSTKRRLINKLKYSKKMGSRKNYEKFAYKPFSFYFCTLQKRLLTYFWISVIFFGPDSGIQNIVPLLKKTLNFFLVCLQRPLGMWVIILLGTLNFRLLHFTAVLACISARMSSGVGMDLIIENNVKL